jgi:anti-sigma-K factor RskA
MDHDAIKELLPLAALDWLEGEEARALEDHLRAGCDECEAELRELREAAAAFALSLEQAGSEERIWERLESRLRTGATTPRATVIEETDSARRIAHRRASVWRIATAVMAAVVVGIAIYAGWTSDELVHVNEAHRQQLASLEGQLHGLRSELIATRNHFDTLQRVLGERIRLQNVMIAPDLRLIRLEPLAPAPAAGAIVAISAANKAAVLQAGGLPATPQGKAYEFWWITKEHGPVAAGLFQAESDHPVVAPVSLPPAGEHLLLSAVTLEPAAGVSKPTGAMYLKGAPGPA